MGLRKDIWRPAIVEAPLADIVRRGSLEGLPVHWLPDMPFQCFLADPFGLWRNGKLHVFVEAYDYRDRIGTIELLIYDAAFGLIARRRVLAEPWHLSYPQIIEAEGETWMLPEAHRSGRLTLYRASRFPDIWEAACDIPLDTVAIDATPIRYNDRWWLFYTGGRTQAQKMGELHVAFAERLTGPWTVHPRNPVHVDLASARPGGTAVVIDGHVVLPVQDCTRTYGGAIRPLRFDRLDPAGVEVTASLPIPAPPSFAPFIEGLHTLSAVGDVTLVDAKHTELSLHGLAIEVRREARKLTRRLAGRRGLTRS